MNDREKTEREKTEREAPCALQTPWAHDAVMGCCCEHRQRKQDPWQPPAQSLTLSNAGLAPGLLQEIGVDALEVYEAFDNVFNARLLEAYTQKLRVFGAEESLISSLSDPDLARQVLEEICEAEGREVPFLQIFHLHEGASKAAAKLREVAASPQLGQLAAELMGAPSVMLYQTCAFVKEPCNGETRWHSDLNTAPFDTNDMLTFWIALTPIPTLDHAPLEFATGSHRDFALPYWYSNEGMSNLDARDYKIKSHQPVPSMSQCALDFVLDGALDGDLGCSILASRLSLSLPFRRRLSLLAARQRQMCAFLPFSCAFNGKSRHPVP